MIDRVVLVEESDPFCWFLVDYLAHVMVGLLKRNERVYCDEILKSLQSNAI